MLTSNKIGRRLKMTLVAVFAMFTTIPLLHTFLQWPVLVQPSRSCSPHSEWSDSTPRLAGTDKRHKLISMVAFREDLGIQGNPLAVRTKSGGVLK